MKKIIPVLLLILVSCAAEPPTQDTAPPETSIDQRSYRLGGIGAFSEMVNMGLKKLALSSPMTPAEMDALMKDAERIARDNGVKIHRETDFLVTDLFPEALTEGKHVLLIHLDPVKDEYMALKALRNALIEQGRYEGEERRDIARQMGRLLSYPEDRIETMLQK